MTICTIGYEGLDIQAFLSLLIKHGVRTVVDIRELPLSRKPGFSKRGLSDILADSGLDYVHMVQLGCPKEVRDRYKKNGSWKQYTKGFLQYLDEQGDALEELAAAAAESRCALLCFEADYTRCHRSFVADALHERFDIDVQHIDVAEAKKGKPGRQLAAAA
ncbi:MAG: hypothetical protein ABS82_17705 [Rhodanobacter sp. SCN 67-45]|nr:MAG: hypothetical protein ABS82_17705 [Rhodanobacter sp. SCN 67-45]